MIERVEGRNNFYEEALDIFLCECQKAIDKKNRFSVALSGGTTPIPLFKLLVNSNLPWDKIDIFIVDERYLPITHKDSNYGNLYEVLLSNISIPVNNIKYIKHMESLEQSRVEYEIEVEEYFKKWGRGMDLIVLGMGLDGHTASIFPDNIELNNTIVPSIEGDLHKYSRTSFSVETINLCKKKLFLLNRSKEDRLIEILKDKNNTYPITSIKGNILYLLEV